MEVKNLEKRNVGWEDIPLDMDTPVSAFMKLRRNGATFLLESVEKGEKVGRYSFIGLEPEEKITLKGNLLTRNGNEISLDKRKAKLIFDEIFGERYSLNCDSIVFWGGWVGYIGYEFVRFLEEINFRKDSEFPEIFLLKTQNLIVFDHVRNKGRIIVGGNFGEERIEEKIQNIKDSLRSDLWKEEREKLFISGRSLKHCISREEFLEKVRIIKEFIKDGDIFQAVLSIRFEGETKACPFNIYRALRMLNPSPYMFYVDFGDFQIIGSSPESHVKVENGSVSMRPIAGTRRRGRNEIEDRELERELIRNEKERAEHIMLIDLARNDLGKICVPGSVSISEKMVIERYSHVMHIVSQVNGKLEEGRTFFDILQATFPAGTVTGAPKLRAMEIIDEMEPVGRGPYGGVVGYLGFNGNLDFCIGIRMIIYKKGKFILQAGAGIVDGSVPENEYKEIINKMKGMQEAIIIAEEGRFL
jgi:anthranilate synthase component 1